MGILDSKSAQWLVTSMISTFWHDIDILVCGKLTTLWLSLTFITIVSKKEDAMRDEAPMTVKLFELAGAEPDRRFSPYCWRTRLALAHKGLAVETIAWRFTDKDVIARSGQGRVPVLFDGDKVIWDSWTIAEYLEDAYADRPSLFGGAEARRLARFINSWADTVVIAALVPILLTDIYAHLHEKDRRYFRESREKRFGMPLEQASADRDTRIAGFRQCLEPARSILAAQPYLAGDQPLYADYILFGTFMWPRSISSFRILNRDDPICSWRERMLDRFDGLARRAPGYAE